MKAQMIARTARVIESCENNAQFEVARKYVVLMLRRMYPRGKHYITFEGLDMYKIYVDHINTVARRKGLSYVALDCGPFKTEPFNAGPR